MELSSKQQATDANSCEQLCPSLLFALEKIESDGKIQEELCDKLLAERIYEELKVNFLDSSV